MIVYNDINKLPIFVWYKVIFKRIGLVGSSMKIRDTEDRMNWKVLLLMAISSMTIGIYRDGFSALSPFLQ